ncbi:MAG TPA: winged helix-turn-helix domain-containing protein, partial [Ktedonobacteraceae bacterium]|nr:winged helix-turn-helix domain-containing protein [Ktedonobacteraceae bacterium]
LRKMGSSDVLDEITGSIGITGAVDGTLILKRERGRQEATLFVTGRDVEQEQNLALSFDATTALWTLMGNAEEVSRTRERQEILDLLKEQFPDGMCPREIAEALDKNYHTIRSLLRKMEAAGDIVHCKKQYVALPNEQALSPSQHVPPSISNDAIDDGDDGDDSDATNGGSTSSPSASTSSVHQTVQPVVAPSSTQVNPQEHESQQQEPSDSSIIEDKSNSTVSSVINHHQRQQCHQLQPPALQEEVPGADTSVKNSMPHTEQSNGLMREKMRCPHHPQERQVRFDSTGQAWCDRMDCWDCYRLMKIGQALHYPCLIDRGGQRVIEQGQESWSRFVRTERAFLVVVATEEARIVCNSLGIAVPDLSGEVSRLQTLYPTPPAP